VRYHHHHGGGFGFFWGLLLGIGIMWVAPEAVKSVVGSAAAAGIEVLHKVID
jgi:hypothetical protein